MCQMFPDAACKAMQGFIRDAAHSMEEVLEVKGSSAFPTLDMVTIFLFMLFLTLLLVTDTVERLHPRGDRCKSLCASREAGSGYI